MRLAPAAITLLALLSLGCDRASEVWSRLRPASGESPAAAERPEGWQSLEGEAAAMRLYYQFVDAKRQVRFVERLEEVPDALRGSVGFVKMAVPPPLTPGDAARTRRAQLASRDAGSTARSASGSVGVVLYSAEWCSACRKAKRHLVRRGVDFEVRDVEDPRNAEELLRRTGTRAIPVLDVEGRMLTGFSATSYDALLEQA